MRLRMRIILVVLLLSICIILMVGIYIQQPRLFGDTATVVTTPIIAITYTPVTNNPVIDLQSVQSTQTVIANQSTVTAIALPATAIINVIATPQSPTVKPVRLPATGSTDSSDIWSNTPIIVLIGICVLLSIGLYWQSKRPLK